jgi:hypothetical protein
LVPGNGERRDAEYKCVVCGETRKAALPPICHGIQMEPVKAT